jgi:cytochrome c556
MMRVPMTCGAVLAAAVLASVAVFACAARAEDKPDDKSVLDYRRALMITLNEQSAALGMVLSGVVPGDPALHLEAIALTASYATKAFTPPVRGGEARPDIWTKWPDFSKRMDEFARKTAAVAKAVREKGPNGVNVLDALACKACHDLYRDEAKR